MKPPTRVLAAVAAALVLASACGGNGVQGQAQPRLAMEDPPSSISAPTATKAASKVAAPARIRIPSIGVDAPIVKVGLAKDGSMQTPSFGKAGWYTEGPRPGEDGPAVVVAHVDSKSGPDVFAKLKQLHKGAKIQVVDRAGKTHTFETGRKQETAKTALPTKAIWGDTNGPALRLITCGGAFDKESGHYVSNVIVWADAT